MTFLRGAISLSKTTVLSVLAPSVGFSLQKYRNINLFPFRPTPVKVGLRTD
jgi:hypothetical protein